jgi:hypothetical protein
MKKAKRNYFRSGRFIFISGFDNSELNKIIITFLAFYNLQILFKDVYGDISEYEYCIEFDNESMAINLEKRLKLII